MASPMSLTKDEFRLLTSEIRPTTIRPQSLERDCPLDNGRLRRQHDPPRSNIGVLTTFPPEILSSIFEIIDLQSLTDFRAVSWGARDLVDHIASYEAIIQRSPGALRALLSTRMAVHFTAQDIFEALCKEACVKCGTFGPFLDLFTADRCCRICTAHSDRFLSITIPSAEREFGLDLETIRKLPTLLSIPGRYAKGQAMHERRINLVRMLSVSAARLQHHKSKIPSRGQAMRLQSLREPEFHRYSRELTPFRYMAMIRVPSLDRRTGKLDWGVSCRACFLSAYKPGIEARGYRDWNTCYSARGYMEHFQECQVSQRGKAEISRSIDPESGELCLSEDQFEEFLRNVEF